MKKVIVVDDDIAILDVVEIILSSMVLMWIPIIPTFDRHSFSWLPWVIIYLKMFLRFPEWKIFS